MQCCYQNSSTLHLWWCNIQFFRLNLKCICCLAQDKSLAINSAGWSSFILQFKEIFEAKGGHSSSRRADPRAQTLLVVPCFSSLTQCLQIVSDPVVHLLELEGLSNPAVVDSNMFLVKRKGFKENHFGFCANAC